MSSNLTVEGKLVAKLDALSGESQNGPWVRREFILELPSSGSFTNKLCVELWGERTSLIDPFQEGEDLVVSIDLSSREFNGKWYTRVRAWQIQRAVPGGMPYQGMPQGYAPQCHSLATHLPPNTHHSPATLSLPTSLHPSHQCSLHQGQSLLTLLQSKIHLPYPMQGQGKICPSRDYREPIGYKMGCRFRRHPIFCTTREDRDRDLC